MRRFLLAAVPLALTLAFAAGAASASGTRELGNVNVDLDHNLQFPQNKQNEPSIARDPLTGVLIAGANDELQDGLCPGTTTPFASPCPFTPGAPTSAYYTSADGTSWAGGFLPGFSTIGRVSGGDPSLDVGPRRCSTGRFSWSCGSVVYYSSLADPFPEFGGEQVTVSRSYTDGASWSNPVAATSTDNKSNFDDHPWLVADKSASSPWFGRVYDFWAVYCNSCAGNGNVKLYLAHSDDEGRTWSTAVQVSAGNNNAAQGFRETGQLAVASDGAVEAFWTENADSKGKYPDLQVVVVSRDGGNTFTTPQTIAPTTDYPLIGTPFDAVDLFNRVPGMSARVDCYPHPASDPTSTAVWVVWCDFTGGTGVVKASVSTDGLHWAAPMTIGQVRGRNAFFPAVDVSPNGLVAVTFDALTAPPSNDPWQTGVQVYDNYYVEKVPGGLFTSPMRVSTASSNPDGSGYNNLQEQFIGDYIDIAAGPTTSYLVWTDARAATPCAAVDEYRTEIYTGVKYPVAPNPDTACAASFGNTDTEAGLVGQ